jgi:hypothetical protein
MSGLEHKPSSAAVDSRSARVSFDRDLRICLRWRSVIWNPAHGAFGAGTAVPVDTPHLLF